MIFGIWNPNLHQNSSSRSLSRRNSTRGSKQVAISILLLMLLFLLLVLFASRSSEEEDQRSYYTVVVDCGSTGTRVSVFEFMVSKAEKTEKELPILLRSYPDDNLTNGSSSCKYHCSQTEPGLHRFAGNRTGVRDSIEPLILRAERIVPVERQGETPIFVMATAGLRRLKREDSSRVLDDVEAVLKDRNFLYRREWVRVLTGREEAYYGWVALNYKMGVFEPRSGSRSSSLGLLDLGGSSLQVAMEVDGDQGMNGRYFRSRFGSVERGIWARSLPDYGLNGAFDRTVLLLLGERSGVGVSELRHPCFGSGFVRNYSCLGCVGNPSLKLVGEPDWERCKSLAVVVATNSSISSRQRLCLDGGNNGTALPRFHALSGFFAVHGALNLSSPKANLTEIWETGQDLCTRSWAQKGDTSPSKSAHYCFRVPYVASMIEDSLCVADAEIVFGPADVSWSLGAAIVEGEYLWSHHSDSRVRGDLGSYQKIVLSPFFVFLVLAGILSVVYWCQVRLPMLGKKGESSRPYSYPRRRHN